MLAGLPAAMTAIFQHTGGIPRRINVLTDRLLLAAYLAEKRTLSMADVEAVAREMGDEIAGSEEPAAVAPMAGNENADAGRGAAARAPVALDMARLEARLAIFPPHATLRTFRTSGSTTEGPGLNCFVNENQSDIHHPIHSHF